MGKRAQQAVSLLDVVETKGAVAATQRNDAAVQDLAAKLASNRLISGKMAKLQWRAKLTLKIIALYELTMTVNARYFLNDPRMYFRGRRSIKTRHTTEDYFGIFLGSLTFLPALWGGLRSWLNRSFDSGRNSGMKIKICRNTHSKYEFY